MQARARQSRSRPGRALLAQRPFRRLWIGQSLSTVGDRLVMVALPLLTVEITRSATQVGVVIGAFELALLAGLPLGGVIGDRFARRKVMLLADLVRAAVHGMVCVLVITGALQLLELIALEVVFGLAQGIFQPAFAGLIPQTVAKDQIQAATGLTRASQYTAVLVGPALAGVLAANGSLGWAFGLDALTFLASALFLVSLRVPAAGARRPRPGAVAAARGALALVAGQRWIWSTIICFSLVAMFSIGPYTVLGPFLAARAYGSPADFGLITAALGGGTLLGALVAMRWRPPGELSLGCAVAGAWPVLLLALAMAAPLALTTVAAVLAGAGLASFSVWWESALAQRIPNEALSRVAALDWMGSLALLPLGCLLAAASASILGPQTTLLLGAVGASAALLSAGWANHVPATAAAAY